MSFERAVILLTLVLELICFQRGGKVSGDSNLGNTITLSEPEKHAVWIIGQNSNPITWTQSKFCFKWNIELLDDKELKVVEISTALSEFKEGVMRHHWIVPLTVQSGDYRVRICETNSPEDCGVSETFLITNKEDLQTLDEQDSEVFSPQQGSTQRFAVSNNTKKEDPGLLPHEMRRKKRLENEQQLLKQITEEIGRTHGDCSIEQVHKPSRDTFVEHYMRLRKPVILTGMMDSWEALTSWDFDKLGDHLTQGVQVDMDIMDGLSSYSRWNEYRLQLASAQKEPAKVVMKNFHQIYPELMESIDFPEFSQDFMELIDEDIRPPQLSFEMTPRRSGSHWRVEPLNASVWSALIVGRKRWGLYPPTQYFVPGVLNNNHRMQDYRSSEAYIWWTYTRPHLHASNTPLDCVQKPGEILYIPSGWWWSNVNLDDSITMQKSACDATNIRACMDELRELADSRGDNYYGDVLIQLRHYLTKHDPSLLTDDDRKFRSPIRGLGKTRKEYGEHFHNKVWKKYFGDEVNPSYNIDN